MTETTTRPSWWGEAERASASAEVDSNVLWRANGSNPQPVPTQAWQDLSVTQPSLSLTDPTDPTQQARASAFHLKATNGDLKGELGRDPSPAEQYVGLRVGVQAAPDVVKAPGDLPLAAVVPQDVLQQHAEEFKGISTVGEYRARAAEKMGEVDYSDPNPGPGRASPAKGADLGPDEPAPQTAPDVTGRTIAGFIASKIKPYDVADHVDMNLDPSVKAALDGAAGSLQGIPLNVISGYRNPAYNARVGGASGSQHMGGKAVDIDLKGLSEDQKKAVVAAVLALPHLR